MAEATLKNAKAALALCASVAALHAGTTWAQDQSQDGSADQGGIQDIVVTAQRRSESAQRVPIAITALPIARLSEGGVSDVRDLAKVAPAVTVFTATGYVSPRIRGIGTLAVGAGIESPVGVYVDNIYYAQPLAGDFPFNNISQVEVLKGPQGTLFGRNATGGLINFITKDPTQDFHANFAAGYSNYQTIDANGYVAGGITDTLTADISARYQHQGQGYGHNLTDGSESNRIFHDASIRSKLVWKPTSLTRIALSLDYSDQKGTFPDFKEFAGEKALFGAAPASGRVWDTDGNVHTLTATRSGGGSLTVNQDVGSLTFVSISAYRESKLDTRFDFDLTPLSAAVLSIVQKDRQFSQEVQLRSRPDQTLSWVIGAYYFNAKSTYDPLNINFSGPLLDPASPTFPIGSTNLIGSQRTESIAGFGQATLKLDERTHLIAGIRYTSDHRTLNASQTATLFDGTPIGSILPPGTGRDAATFNKVTWRVSVDHNFGDVLAYASFNRGFKSGGFNVSTPERGAYRPEVLDAYEVGLKADLLNRRVRLNPSFFYYRYSDIQVAVALPTGALGLENGPKATVYGFDLDGEVVVTNAFHLTGGITVLHDRFGSYPAATANVPLATGGNAQVTVDAKGNRFPFTSDLVTTLGATYTISSDIGKFLISGNWNYNNGYFIDAANLRKQQSYSLLDAAVRWTSRDEHVYARVWGSNLTDKPVITFGNQAPFGSGTSYNRPRTYGVTLGVNW